MKSWVRVSFDMVAPSSYRPRAGTVLTGAGRPARPRASEPLRRPWPQVSESLPGMLVHGPASTRAGRRPAVTRPRTPRLGGHPTVGRPLLASGGHAVRVGPGGEAWRRPEEGTCDGDRTATFDGARRSAGPAAPPARRGRRPASWRRACWPPAARPRRRATDRRRSSGNVLLGGHVPRARRPVHDASRPRSTRPSPATGSWSLPATTTRRPTATPADRPGPRRQRRRHDHHAGHPPAGHGPLHRGRRRHQARLRRECSSEPRRPDLRRRGLRRQDRRSQRHRGVEGRRRDRRQPDRLQLPRPAPATPATRSGGTAAPTAAQIGPARLRGQLPHRRRRRSSATTNTAAQYGIFSSNSAGPGHLEPDLRQQLQRLRRVRGRLPAGLRHHDQPRLGGVQRPRLLGHQLGRGHRGRELAVRQQQGRIRHQHPDRR